jgi:predicted metal-dependent hydrolase
MDYRLIRTKRKTIALYVRNDGSVEVRAPLRANRSTIDTFVSSKQTWIERKVTQARQPYVAAFQHAEEVLAEQYRLACAWMGLSQERAPRLRLRAMTSRWGSYSAKTHTISLNKHLTEASLEAIQMVCIHELCHIKNRAHDRAFYREMDTYLDFDWRQERKALRRIPLR